jgi:hypothetical protein
LVIIDAVNQGCSPETRINAASCRIY